MNSEGILQAMPQDRNTPTKTDIPKQRLSVRRNIYLTENLNEKGNNMYNLLSLH